MFKSLLRNKRIDAKVNLSSCWMPPLIQRLGLFNGKEAVCNQTHKFAALANLCFQIACFANGKAGQTHLAHPEF